MATEALWTQLDRVHIDHDSESASATSKPGTRETRASSSVCTSPCLGKLCTSCMHVYMYICLYCCLSAVCSILGAPGRGSAVVKGSTGLERMSGLAGAAGKPSQRGITTRLKVSQVSE